MTPFKTILICLVVLAQSLQAAYTLPAVPSTPMNVVIDTDITYDGDDAQAVVVALRLQQMGYFRIKAITTSTHLNYAPAFVNLLLYHGGLTTADIPIGAYQGGTVSCGVSDNYGLSTLNDSVANNGYVPVVTRASFPAAAGVLRAALGSSANNSVTMIVLGGNSNISALLQSAANAGGDGYPDGQTLWNTKVVKMVMQSGGFPPSPYTASPYTPGTLKSFNIGCDPTSAKYVFEHNAAVPIIFTPLQVSLKVGGCYDGTGAGCGPVYLPPNSPYRVAMDKLILAGGTYTKGSGNNGKPYAWDPSAAFYALTGTADPGGGVYFTTSAPGTLSIVTSPATQTWHTDVSSNHYFNINSSRWAEMGDALNDLILADYVPAAQTHPRLLLNDKVSDTWNPGSYPGGGTSGRLAAIAARAGGGSSTAAADWATVRSIATTGGSPAVFLNSGDEGSLDQVMAYGLSYALYHRSGNDTAANPYALALYNGLLSVGTAYGATKPVYDVTQVSVASNVATVTLSTTVGSEVTVGSSFGLWGCSLTHDSYCGGTGATGWTLSYVSGNTVKFTMSGAAPVDITDPGMVFGIGYTGVDNKAFVGVALASLSYLYDWCYPWLVANNHTDEVIRQIKAAYWSSTLTRGSSNFYNAVREGDYHNYAVWPETAILEAGIALNGDDPLGSTMLAEGLGYLYQGISVRPAAAVNESYTYNIKASIDAMTEGALNWEGSQYWRAGALRILRAIEAYDSSNGRALDIWNTQFPNTPNAGMYRIYARDPAGTMANFGENYNLFAYSGRDAMGLSIINDRFPDAHFKWMMDTGINSWNDGTTQAGLVWKLLFYPYVNGPVSHDLTDLPLSRRFGTDVVIRSGWGANDTMFTITGSLKGVFHRKNDAGGFSLYKNGYLALPANYKTSSAPVHDEWMKRAVGNNTLTIYDSTDCWIDNVATCGVDSNGNPAANDGGQRTTLRRLNPPFSVNQFELVRLWSGTLYTDPLFSTIYNEVAGVTFPTLTAGSGYEHVSLDMSKAYTNGYSGFGNNVHAKTPTSNGVVRSVVHFQPVSGSVDPVIIFDRVTAMNSSFSKSWIVHTVGAPQLGETWTSASAGITDNSNSAMRTDNGTGRLYVHSLLPATPNMRTVGGNACAPLVITDATKASPGVFTVPSHGLAVGEYIGIDVGTYSATATFGYNGFGAHSQWPLDTNVFTVGSVIDADHITLKIGPTPYNTSSLQTFAGTFGYVGAGSPTTPGTFTNQMYYQTDASGGNSAWWWSGTAWVHIGVNGNGLTAPTIYKHTACEYGYWVDQLGPEGSAGKSIWRPEQDWMPVKGQAQWRVEVKPTVPATTNYFLNVLTPTSTSDTTGPAAVSISATGWHGAQVSDGIETFVAMFPEDSGSTGVTYTASHSGGGRHVVTGLTPATLYPVVQNGSVLASPTSDAQGSITFSEAGGGEFAIGESSSIPGTAASRVSGYTVRGRRIVK